MWVKKFLKMKNKNHIQVVSFFVKCHFTQYFRHQHIGKKMQVIIILFVY